MTTEPERYGALKQTTTLKPFGLGHRTTTEPARGAAPRAARQGRAYATAQQSVTRAEAEAGRASEVQRVTSAELSGVRRAVRESGPLEFGPAAVRARLDRLDRALREKQAPVLAPARLKGLAAETLTARIGSAGMSVAKTTARAASKSVGRGE